MTKFWIIRVDAEGRRQKKPDEIDLAFIPGTLAIQVCERDWLWGPDDFSIEIYSLNPKFSKGIKPVEVATRMTI
jgi:hypothetical protein